MKKTLLRHAFIATLFIAGLSFTSCRDNNQNEGVEDAQETNSDTYGTDGTLDNEGSGSAAGSGVYDTTTDTVQGTTTGGNPTTTGSGSGTGAGTNNGGNGTGTGTGTNNNGGM